MPVTKHEVLIHSECLTKQNLELHTFTKETLTGNKK